MDALFPSLMHRRERKEDESEAEEETKSFRTRVFNAGPAFARLFIRSRRDGLAPNGQQCVGSAYGAERSAVSSGQRER